MVPAACPVPVNRSDSSEVHLQGRLQLLLLGANAASSLKKYSGPWARFQAWCASLAQPRVALPASAETVALYLAHVFDSCLRKGLGPATVLTASSAIHAAHELAGLGAPTQHPLVQRARRGAERMLGSTVSNRKEPLTAAMVIQLVERWAGPAAPPVQVMLVALVTLLFSGGFRFSDVAGLRVSSFSFEEGMVLVWVPKRKNDQRREGDEVPIAAGSSVACPVGLLQRVVQGSSLAPGDFMFRDFNGHRAEALGYQCVFQPARPLPYQKARYHIIKFLAAAFGRSVKECEALFGLHSGRSGLASSAVEAGVPQELVVRHVGWRSDKSLQHYLKRDVGARLAVSKSLGL